MGFAEVYDYVAGRVDWFAAGLPGEGESMEVPRIGPLAETPCTCGPWDLVGPLRERLPGDAWELCVVLDEGGVVLGVVRPGDLDGDPDEPADRVMDPAPSTFRPDVGVEELRSWFGRHPEAGAAPVTTPEGTLLGIITVKRLDAQVRTASGAG